MAGFDFTPGVLTVVSAPGQLTEGTDRTLKITLKFDNVSSVDTTIRVALAQGSTAVGGVDVPVGEVTDRVRANLSPAGPYSYSFSAFPILDDAIAEPTKTLTFTVTSPGLTFQNGSNSITIDVKLLDNDTGAPTPTTPVTTNPSTTTPTTTTPTTTPTTTTPTTTTPVVTSPTGPSIGVDPLLATAIQNVLRVHPLSSATANLAYSLTGEINAGRMTEAQATAEVVKAADATTTVATLSYQFFTGKLPSMAGLDYLVSPTGSNANNLNSAYYQGFNIENRYINFAVNLGKLGAGRAEFEAAYGNKSLGETVRSAYLTIFGAPADDAKAAALLAGRIDYFASYGGDGPSGIGTKAAAVGWLLAEAAKADVGLYSKSSDAFLIDLADGDAGFGVDLVGVYGRAEYIPLA